jgi:hypothetical protein
MRKIFCLFLSMLLTACGTLNVSVNPNANDNVNVNDNVNANVNANSNGPRSTLNTPRSTLNPQPSTLNAQPFWYQDEAQLLTDFKAAMADAQQVSESKVSHSLMPVRTDNPALEWKQIGDANMVLVCVMINDKKRQLFAAEDTFRLPKEAGVWVTLPADWKRKADAFAGLDSVAANKRMVQMLGLRPECDYYLMVELYVDARGLFRPAFDPDITTTTSPTSFPAYADESYTIGVTNFREWYAYNKVSAYADDGCPWTQLGYTYDWHHGAPREGVSEYVAAYGTLAKVKSSRSFWSFIRGVGE